MFTYYKRIDWQLTPIEAYFMPFICKIYPETAITRQTNYPVRVDPALQLNTCKNYREFHPFEIMLHHYSMIRVDIDNKFRNAAASIRWTKEQIETFKSEFKNYTLEENKGISYFQGRKVRKVEDHFGLQNVL